MRPKRIGVFHKENRNWYRNITRHEHEHYRFYRYYDVSRVANAMRRRFGGGSLFRKHTRIPPSYPRVDLYHHWATVDFGSRPWVVSSSVGLPFGWPADRYQRGLELLASDSCKRIIVTGKCALEWQRAKVLREPSLEAAIMGKVEVLPPVQDPIVSDWGEKHIDLGETLRLVFVGGDFFRKGGLELVRVVQRLITEGADLKLDVVSSLSMTALTGDTEENLVEARAIMDESSRITWHGRLSNHKVLELFKRAHIGLLPSYVETYGYSVLEAQACGCATITTDIKAFPDINPDDVGWRIGIDGDEYDFRSEEGRILISELLEKGLYSILSEALNHVASVREKGQAALNRVEKEHSPERHRKVVQSIYEQALTNS